MIETTDDKNKLGSNYKVLDAATQAKLQADYPNTLKMQEGWANFDFVSTVALYHYTYSNTNENSQ